MQSEERNFWIVEVKVRPPLAQGVSTKLLLETPADWLVPDQSIFPERVFKPVSAALNTTFPVTFTGARNAEKEISDQYSTKKCDYSDSDCRVWLIDNAARHQQ
jgi:hypothetical protein